MDSLSVVENVKTLSNKSDKEPPDPITTTKFTDFWFRSHRQILKDDGIQP